MTEHTERLRFGKVVPSSPGARQVCTGQFCTGQFGSGLGGVAVGGTVHAGTELVCVRGITTTETQTRIINLSVFGLSGGIGRLTGHGWRRIRGFKPLTNPPVPEGAQASDGAVRQIWHAGWIERPPAGASPPIFSRCPDRSHRPFRD